ncbi:unnamed protein product [marine sediment metagenome]|uniref:Uncharacterized protein n=1 Tax=marine sediment metagenome TaxID=412755 RepID=X1V4F6_9ZZZZ
MGPKEAIERLTDETVQLRHGINPKWVEAVKLGIEALKLLEKIPLLPVQPGRELLPGETPD